MIFIKHLIILLFTFAFCSFCYEVNAQNGGCNTKLSIEQKNWLKQFQQNLNNFENAKTKSVTQYIPIKAHIIGDDNGNGYYSVNNLLQVICELNIKFAPVDFIFYIDGEINFINNTLFLNDGASNEAFISMANNNVEDKLNIYFVSASPGLCGYFTPFPDAVVIIEACGLPGNTTVAHEIGHFFSLPHTFSGFENGDIPALSDQEMVNGNNCSSAGDGFCDTPADFLYSRWLCPYLGTKLDQNGDAYNPDKTLFMSYAADNCCNRFSNEQILAMQANVAGPRNNLTINNITPSSLVANTTSLVLPVNYTTDVYANNALFSWRNASAEAYFIEVSKYNSNNVVFQKIVTDTFCVANNLKLNTTYHWRVKAFNRAMPCTSFSEKRLFITAENFQTSINDIKESSFTTTNFYPTIFQKNESYILRWKLDNIIPSQFIVYDMLGQVITAKALLKNNSNYFEIDKKLLAGTYVVKIMSNENVFFQKIVIN
jgi:hypothetical protein